jgi:EpsI family protein
MEGITTIDESKKRFSRFWVLLAVLLLGGLFINWFEARGEAHVTRKTLAEFPLSLGDWKQKGEEYRFGEAVESVLRTTDYTDRKYEAPDGRLADIYVGYYSSQRTGATYHSPQNCLPGAGWVMKEPGRIEIPLADGTRFTANRYIIENGKYKELMIYWYQGRGRKEASEYSDKINTVWDSVLRRRTDGSMVRVMTGVGEEEESAVKAAVDISARVAEQLSAYVPE